MKRVIEEMAKAKGDVEKRLRYYIPEIIKECVAFAYLGKAFTFNESDLSERVNKRLISLSDDILSDIEERAKKSIRYADEEEDEDAILAYIRRPINDEDIVERLDKHCSALRYFLEGWIAIGMVNGLKEHELTNQILAYIDNPIASPLWQQARNAGYFSDSIRSGVYLYGKGNQRNVLSALTEIGRYAINEAYQFGCVLNYRKMGAIGYTTHRASSFDCSHCDELTMIVHPLDKYVLPAHLRCVCYSTPVYEDGLNFPEGKELTYYNPNTKGWVITDTSRRLKGEQNKQLRDIYNKEKSMCIVLADNGYKISHLGEISGISSSDITINGVSADLKKTKSANNIKKYAKKALDKQGANIVVFEFEEDSKEIRNELNNLKKKGKKVKYFFSGKNKVYSL